MHTLNNRLKQNDGVIYLYVTNPSDFIEIQKYLFKKNCQWIHTEKNLHFVYNFPFYIELVKYEYIPHWEMSLPIMSNIATYSHHEFKDENIIRNITFRKQKLLKLQKISQENS